MIVSGEATTVAPASSPADRAGGAQSSAPNSSESHIDGFFDKAIDKLKTFEANLQEKFSATADSSNALMRMPEEMVQEMRRLEASARTPEERAVVERFKEGVTETFKDNREHMIAQFNSKLDSAEMKLGAAFVTKTVQGVQQLLSAT